MGNVDHNNHLMIVDLLFTLDPFALITGKQWSHNLCTVWPQLVQSLFIDYMRKMMM